MSKKVALVGYGYWGKNLARVFDSLGALALIVEPDPKRGLDAEKLYPNRVAMELGPRNSDYDLVAIATPPETHYSLALAALNAGKGVFVEKPLCTTASNARSLLMTAQQLRLPLATGHIYLHCAGIKAMPLPIGPATLSVKLLNPEGGPSPSTQDMLWGALPHAISLCYHFFRVPPSRIEAPTFTHREMQLVMEWWNGSRAFIEVADHTGEKTRFVELRSQGNAWGCNISDPSVLKVAWDGEWENIPCSDPEEPLLTEAKAFLEQVKPDPMGTRVVETICGLVDRWETRLGRP